MESIDYLRILQRRWAVVALCAGLAFIIGFATTPARPSLRVGTRTFTATNTLIVSPDADPTSRRSLSLTTTALLVSKGEVPKRAAAKLHYEGSPGALGASVKATADEKTGTLAITVNNRDGAQATRVANTFAAELLSYLKERSVAAPATEPR